MTPSILHFSDVTISASSHYETGLTNVSFELAPGDLLLVRIERENERLPLADASQGLLQTDSGSVSFLGHSWQKLSIDRAAAERGRIGRLFDDEGWISDLDVDENILLSQLHHTKRTEADIMAEALKFARIFGLPGLPRGRPGKVRRWDLRKAACIRAFLGKPTLIILEQPVRGVYADFMAPLLNAVQSARQRAAAVLWMVTDPQIWSKAAMNATTRARMLGSELQVIEEGV
jgi:phospholipid/cholesterol/gamma-HCH transport system ATP-binding protein